MNNEISPDKILVRLLQNTHIPSNKRKDNIVDIAILIKNLEKEVGDLNAVGKQLMLSKGTLKKFLSALSLSEPVIELVKQRKIDSIEVVYFLSRCTKDEQRFVAGCVLNETLSSSDIKDGLSPLKSQNPDTPIEELVEKLIKSKDKSISVAYLDYPEKYSDVETVKKRLYKIVEKDFISLEFTPDYGILKITKKGEKKLRNVAKNQNQPLKDLLTQLMK